MTVSSERANAVLRAADAYRAARLARERLEHEPKVPLRLKGDASYAILYAERELCRLAALPDDATEFHKSTG